MNFNEGKKKDLIASIVCFIILLAIGLSMTFAPLISSENIAEKYAKRLDYKIIREEKEEKSDKKDSEYYSYGYSKQEKEEPSEEEIEIQRDLNAIKKSEDNITLKTEITMFLKYMKYSNSVESDKQITFNSEWTITCIILILLGGGIVISLICGIVQIFSWIFSKYSYGMSCMMLKFVFTFWVITTVLLGLQYNYFSICQDIGIVYLFSGASVILFFVISSLFNILYNLNQNENKYEEMTNNFALVLVMILAMLSFTNISGNIIGIVDTSAYDGNIPIIFTGVTGSSLLNMGIEGKANSEYEEETEKIISQKKQKNNEDEISKEYRNMIKGAQSMIECGIFLISIMFISLIIFLANASSKLTRLQLVLNIIFAVANIGLFILFRVKVNEINDYFRKADMYGLNASLMIYSGIFLNICMILISLWKIKVNHIIQKRMVSETAEQPVVE